MSDPENSVQSDAALRTKALTGASPTVVFINGLGETLDFWQPVTDRLAGLAMLLYDRAAQDRDQPEGSLMAEIDQIDDVLAAVEGRLLLVGHSYGGVLAEAYARAHPDRVAGLVLLDPSVPAEYADDDGDPRVGPVRRGAQSLMKSDTLRPVVKRALPRAMISFGTSKGKTRGILAALPSELADRISDPRHIERAMFDNTHIGGVCAEVLIQRTTTPLPTIPVRIMVGKLGPRVWRREQRAWVADQREQLPAFGPQAELTELDGAHILMLDCPDDVAEAIRSAHGSSDGDSRESGTSE